MLPLKRPSPDCLPTVGCRNHDIASNPFNIGDFSTGC